MWSKASQNLCQSCQPHPCKMEHDAPSPHLPHNVSHSTMSTADTVAMLRRARDRATAMSEDEGEEDSEEEGWDDALLPTGRCAMASKRRTGPPVSNGGGGHGPPDGSDSGDEVRAEGVHSSTYISILYHSKLALCYSFICGPTFR